MRKVLVFLALMLMTVPAWAEGTLSMKDVLTGKAYPLSMKLKDLNSEWVRLNSSGQFDIGNYMGVLSSMFGGGASSGYYTKGDTAKIADETYLVTYHAKVKSISLADMQKSAPPAQEKLTADTELLLSLLNLRTAGNLTDIRPFDLSSEIAASAESGGLMEDILSGAASGAAASESLSNLKCLGTALMMYTQDWDGGIPPTNNWSRLKSALEPYVKDANYLTNPMTKEPYRANPSVSGRRLAQIKDPGSMVVFYEATPAPDGTRGVTFLNGNAKRIPESEWPRVKTASKIP